MIAFFKSFIVSGANIAGPVLLLIVFQKITNPEIFINNYRNYYNVTFLSTFITLQAQATMLRRNFGNSLQNDLIYFVKRSFHNLFYGVIIGVILFLILNDILFPTTKAIDFIYCLISAYFFQIFQGIINILNRRRSLNYQIFSILLFYLVQLILILILAQVTPNSNTLRIFVIVFASTLLLLLIYQIRQARTTTYQENEDALKLYERWLVPHVVSAYLLANYERIYIINHFEYQLSYEFILLSQFIMLLSVVPMTINRIIVPKIFDGEIHLGKDKIKKVGYLLAAFFLLFMTYAAVISFIFTEVLYYQSITDWRIFFIMSLLQYLNMIYLILITFLHHKYDTFSISIITVSISVFYLACLNIFAIESILGVVTIALAAKFIQIVAVSCKVWPKKHA